MDFTLNEEQKMLQSMVKEFTEKEVEPRAKRIDDTDEFPADLAKRLGEMNLLGLPYPEKYGGTGMGYLAYALAVEQIAMSSCMVAGLVTALGNAEEGLFRYGNEEQKKKYLTPLCRGEMIGCWAFTEPATGSDPKAIQSRAKLVGNEWILNGEKRFITPAPYADLAIIFAKTDDERVSAFIVDTHQPGFSTSSHYHKMGDHGSATADIFMDEVKVPKENLLGQKGQGYRILLEGITTGKLGWSARGLGMAQRGLDESVKYAKERIVHGKPLAELLSTQWLLAEMLAKIEAIRWLVYRVAWLRDQGQYIGAEVALAKFLSAGFSVDVLRQALQVHGSYGYISDFKVEQLYRDTKLNEVIEGSQELQRVIIAAGLLGAK